jgi:hypothetical protein
MALLHPRSGTEEARRRDGTYTDVLAILAKNLRLRYSNYKHSWSLGNAHSSFIPLSVV